MLIESVEEKIALLKEVLPRTLRSLFMMRICLCVVAILLALARITLSPPIAPFLISIFTDGTTNLDAWARSGDVLVSGLLAAFLALIIATFFIQARLKAQADEYRAELRAAA